MVTTRKATLTGGTRKPKLVPAKKRAAKKRAPTTKRPKVGKRTLLENASGKHYIRRRKTGTFKTMVAVGKSLAADRRTKAATKVKKGQGDKGDVE